MLFLHAVPAVPASHRFDRRKQLVEAFKTTHGDGDDLHQLLALFGHVRLREQRFERRVELEQPAVEQFRRRVRDRNDLLPAGLDEGDL